MYYVYIICSSNFLTISYIAFSLLHFSLGSVCDIVSHRVRVYVGDLNDNIIYIYHVPIERVCVPISVSSLT